MTTGNGEYNKSTWVGEKLFMKSTTSSWETLASLGFKVFDVDKQIKLERLDSHSANVNTEIIKNYFNKDKLVSQLKTIFLQD